MSGKDNGVPDPTGALYLPTTGFPPLLSGPAPTAYRATHVQAQYYRRAPPQTTQLPSRASSEPSNLAWSQDEDTKLLEQDECNWSKNLRRIMGAST